MAETVLLVSELAIVSELALVSELAPVLDNRTIWRSVRIVPTVTSNHRSKNLPE